ncbi:MAG: isopenicillin N synthase family oxygenase [Bauldia sp.]|nr:isopenicillin N synthase family oxygenase [Bauldia sp.]
MSEMKLAVVDIDPFINGDEADRKKVARAFGDAFETTGFAVIVGHGVPESLATDLYDCMTAFFAEPYEEKAAFTPPEKAKGRGYLPIGIESVAKTLTGETPPDLCEALVFSAPHRPENPNRPNIWPDTPAALPGLVNDYTGHMVTLTGRLARMSALALDLPEGYFADAYADPALVLRFVNYPDQPEPPLPGQMRYGEHHDYGALTILRQDAAPGGLQIKDADGEWKEAGIVPGSFIINVGDLMARWTNNRWRSTLHRVSNPDRGLTGSTRRLSMVAFTGPNEQWEVSCLPSCTDDEHPALFEPITAGDYVRAKIAESMELHPGT